MNGAHSRGSTRHLLGGGALPMSVAIVAAAAVGGVTLSMAAKHPAPEAGTAALAQVTTETTFPSTEPSVSPSSEPSGLAEKLGMSSWETRVPGPSVRVRVLPTVTPSPTPPPGRVPAPVDETPSRTSEPKRTPVDLPSTPPPPPPPPAPANLTVEQIFVPASSAGVSTRGLLVAGATYRMTVTGTYSYGGGSADAECLTAVGGSEWHRKAYDAGFPTDRFDLFVNGGDRKFLPVGSANGLCSLSHTYTADHAEKTGGHLRLRLQDVDRSRASGGVTVEIRRL